jgi:NAD(P)-dependent dehydrogenase (short-subunit alcohol dehydrogenase family)
MLKKQALRRFGQGRWPAKSVALEIDTPMVQAMTAKDPHATEGFLKNQPNGRMGRPEEVASAVVWLFGAGARYVLGHALVVDGGLTVR